MLKTFTWRRHYLLASKFQDWLSKNTPKERALLPCDLIPLYLPSTQILAIVIRKPISRGYNNLSLVDPNSDKKSYDEEH